MTLTPQIRTSTQGLRMYIVKLSGKIIKIGSNSEFLVGAKDFHMQIQQWNHVGHTNLLH